MSEEKYRILLSGYIDNELSADEKQDFEVHLEGCAECRKELESFQKLQEVTGAMKYADIPEQVWEGYWSSLYKRMERGVSWIFISIAAIILLCFGGYHIFTDFFLDPKAPLLLKIGFGCGIFGLIVLLVSILRERLFAKKRDRYDEVSR
ncbi:MAG: zf-HC2 domain-containing protein [candidate division Zixibacteria bacterium]|nr:zf-HC2 domain-containing protein [candidate division Zixibacteria bacterium]